MSNERPARPALRFTFHSLLSPVSLSLGLAFLAAAPLFANPGFLSTRNLGESPFLLQRLHQLLAALTTGQFPARWMPDAAYGYGFPFFNYYASLPYYFAALFRFYGFSFVLSLKLTQLVALLVAAAGAYAWARSLGRSSPQAFLASAAYTFAPFHLVNVYARGDSLSELWAMAWYPLILWRAHRWHEAPTFIQAFTLALCVGGLIVTHNISALLFMPFLIFYLMPRSWTTYKNAKALLPSSCEALLLPLLWGLALSAFFWLPALGETSAVQIGGANSGFFAYTQHFRSTDLIQPTWFFNFDALPGQPTPMSIGLVQALALAAGLGVSAWRIFRQRRLESGDGFLLIGLALSTWLMTPASAWVWEYMPLLPYAQFPWRFLSIQSLFAALVIARLTPPSPVVGQPQLPITNYALRFIAKHPFGTPYALASLLALSTLGHLRPDFIPLADADVTVERLRLYETFTANMGSTIGYEYLPNAVQPRPYISDAVLGRAPRLKVLSGAASGEQAWKRGANEQWTIDVEGSGATLAVPTFYWPGWQAEVNGQSLAVRPAESLGWITFDLPAGQHAVKLWLGRTPLRALAEGLSLLALILPVNLWLYRRARGERRRFDVTFSPRHLVALSFLIVGSIALHTWPPRESPLPLSIDLTQLTYLHHDAIRFADGTRLTQITYNTQALSRGDSLRVEMNWQVTQPSWVAFRLMPSSDLLTPAPLTLAVNIIPLTPETQVYAIELPTSHFIPPGVYWIAVKHSSGPALTSAGRPRGTVMLGPITVGGPTVQAPAEIIANIGPEIQLVSAQAQSDAPNGVRVDLLWHALADIPRNYGLSLRLRDVTGNEWAALDSQTGGGFYPTTLWQPDETIPDPYRLPLPPGTPPGDYTLTVSLYDPLSLASIGEARITATLTAATPSYLGDNPVHFLLTPEIGLDKIEFPAEVTQGDAPELAAHWITLAEPTHNYRARWTLLAADGVSATQTLDLAPGALPTHWPANMFVLGRVRLPIPSELAAGDYSLYLQLIDENEQPVGTSVLVAGLRVAGRPRVFALPPMQTEARATFGDSLKLWGYDAERIEHEVKLTLVWGALEAPGRDYKFFVHLFNPTDESVPAQVDAMPRNFTYPTGLWVKGEVVTDTVRLDLANVPAGEYRVAVGWYDPALPEARLPAFDAQGQPLDFNRVVLPLLVEVP